MNISPKISILFAQKWHFCTKIDIDRNTCHLASKFAWHYFITLLKNSVIWPKTDAFCIKCYFLLKQKKKRPKIDTFQKQKTLLWEYLISPLKTKIFENCDYWLQKWKKKLQNFCKIFDFTSEAHITKKLTLPKQIVIFFRIDN